MASVLKVDKLDPQSGTALEIGTSGDTISVPSGATLDISASTLTPPATMPASSGVNLTALNATNLGSGTVPTARLGTGTASSSTVLYGDQTYKAEPGIEQVQLWNLTTAFVGAGSPNWGNIIANWSASAVTNTIGTPTMGSAPVTESSGIFSFISTGYHRIDFTCSVADNSAADKDIFGTIKCTKNNSTYAAAARSGMSLTEASMVMSSHATLLLDVTDLTNQKVMFAADGIDTSTYCYGHADYQHTYAIFTRLGDT